MYHNRNTFDGYARYDSRLRDQYLEGWYPGDPFKTMESTLFYKWLNRHLFLANPSAHRRAQINRRARRCIVR